MTRKVLQEVSFTISNGVKIHVFHNLPLDVKGFTISDAANSWLARTKEYTSKSFCDYVLSKRSTLPNVICMTKEEYAKMKC